MVGLGDDLRVQGGDLVREVRGVVGLGGDLRLQGGDLVRLDIHLVFPLINFALPVQLHDVGNPTACPSLPPEVTGIARGVHRGRILGVPGHAHVLVQVPGHAQEKNTRQTGNHHDRPDPSGRLRYSSARRAVDERRALVIRRRGDVRCLDVHRDVSKRAPQGRACRCAVRWIALLNAFFPKTFNMHDFTRHLDRATHFWTLHGFTLLVKDITRLKTKWDQ